MEVISIFLIFLLYIGLSTGEVSNYQNWNSLFTRKGLSYALLFWVLVGFVLRIHLTTYTALYSGPEAVEEPFLGIKNILMLVVPGGLVLSSYLSQVKLRSFTLFALELALWFYIYFYLKESYAWGYYPTFYYQMYDYVALTLRILLLLHFLRIKEYRILITWVVAYILISSKGSYGHYSCFG
jgi:hypothetical protein